MKIVYYCMLHKKKGDMIFKNRCIKNISWRDRKRKKFCKYLIVYEEKDNA